jgi:hypothetical protein
MPTSNANTGAETTTTSDTALPALGSYITRTPAPPPYFDLEDPNTLPDMYKELDAYIKISKKAVAKKTGEDKEKGAEDIAEMEELLRMIAFAMEMDKVEMQKEQPHEKDKEKTTTGDNQSTPENSNEYKKAVTEMLKLFLNKSARDNTADMVALGKQLLQVKAELRNEWGDIWQEVVLELVKYAWSSQQRPPEEVGI